MSEAGFSAKDEVIVDPPRYSRGGFTLWDVEKAFDDGNGLSGFETHLRNNVFEYLMRFPQKFGVPDIKKARVNLGKMIAVHNGEKTDTDITLQQVENAFGERSLTPHELNLRNGIVEIIMTFKHSHDSSILEEAKKMMDELISSLEGRGYQSSGL